MRLIPVFRALGGFLVGLSLLMIPPFLMDFTTPGQDSTYFAISIMASLFTGAALLILSTTSEPFNLTRREAFLVTAVTWTVVPAFAAIPFLGVGLTHGASYFEAVSGFTTTGATVISGLDQQPQGVLLWRSMLHFIGGVGIVFLGIVIMPFLRVAGMQLFRTESSDQSEKIFSKGHDLALWIGGVYLGLNILCAGVYAALGMSAFDAVVHAMGTIATGGFSSHDASFGYFNDAAIDWAATFFMISGGLPFVAYIRMLKLRKSALLNDIQARGFIGFLALTSLILAVTRVGSSDSEFADAFRQSAFSVVSIVTTTGFATVDYQSWGTFAVGAFFVLTFIGGCSGSTAGGIKIYRIQILWKLAMAHLSRLVSPSRVVVVSYSTRRVDDEVAFSILTFLVAMLATVALSTILLSWLGLDIVTALTGSVTCITNTGPGLGSIIGPAGNFSTIPDPALAVLSVAMILGRLEFFTLLVLLTPAFWRD